MIGEGSVGVSFEGSFEVMVDGRCWVRLGVVVLGLVMCGVVGHSVEEVAVVVESWGEEEEVKVD